jgi:hypothetical protein
MQWLKECGQLMLCCCQGAAVCWLVNVFFVPRGFVSGQLVLSDPSGSRGLNQEQAPRLSSCTTAASSVRAEVAQVGNCGILVDSITQAYFF